jgi:uncharacterized tellurite resistance protein B-like protein
VTTPRVDRIADLLMGAAHADRRMDGHELETVKGLLCRFMSVTELPDWLEWRIADFDVTHLDVEACVAKLGLTTEDEKRHLLELIASVHESDDTWDLDEDAYLRRVAEALALPEDAWSDLTVSELSIDRISRALIPPPLPKS